MQALLLLRLIADNARDMLPIVLVVGLFQALVIDQPLPGAAATSAINIPLMAALAVGLATTIRGRSPLIDQGVAVGGHAVDVCEIPAHDVADGHENPSLIAGPRPSWTPP